MFKQTASQNAKDPNIEKLNLEQKLFVPSQTFEPSLIFVLKAGAYLSGALVTGAPALHVP